VKNTEVHEGGFFMSRFKKGKVLKSYSEAEYDRYTYGENVCYGDHVQFGVLTNRHISKIKGEINDPKPK